MPGTHDEFALVVRMLLADELAPDNVEGVVWSDGTKITSDEVRNVFALGIYEMRLRMTQRKPAQRRALRLLRSLLTPEQRAQYRASKCFRVRGSNGGMYRLYPCSGVTYQCERHGHHWYDVRSFCLHDLTERCPNADTAVAHLLLLSCDEAEFLREANSKERRPQNWDGDYMRRMLAARRRERETAHG